MKLRNIKRGDIFSAGLFREGMLQLRAIGIAFICLCTLCGIYDCIDYSGGDQIYDQSPGVMILLATYVVAPVMYLTIFRFLNSRSASDFYHAIPRSRLSLAVSFSAAVGAWLGIALLCNFLLNIFAAIVDLQTALDFVAWGRAILGCIATFVQLTGIVLIGVSIANNLVNQVTIIALIAFLPRALLSYFSSLIEDFAPVLFGLSDTLGIFADNEINLLCGGLVSNSVYPLSSCAYSFVLGTIYTVIGLVLFCHRRSETATQSAVNKTVQTVIRVAVAFVLCMIPAGELAEQVFDPRSHYDFFDDGGFIIYGLAIIAYFLYEAVSTRRLKGLFKLTPDMVLGFVALVVLNLAIIFGVPFAANVALDRPLNIDTVKSVSIYNPHSSTPTYENLIASQVDFDDPDVIELMCDSLEGNVDLIKAGSGNSLNYRYDNEYTTAYAVKMNLRSGGYVKRIIYMLPSDAAELGDSMMKSDNYIESMRTFPKWSQCDDAYISGFHNYATSQNYHDIYKALKTELDMMSDEDYYRYMAQDFKQSENVVLGELYLSGLLDDQYWESSYAICPMVPKTADLYMKLSNKNAPYSIDELWDNCRSADSADDDSFYDFEFFIVPYNMDTVYGDGFSSYDNHYVNAGYDSYDENIMDRIADSADKPVDCTKPFFAISTYYVTDNYNYNDCMYFVSAEDFIVPQEEISSADLHVSLDEMLGG